MRRKARALVYYLAAHRGPVAREQLLALLWPDLEERAARHTLSATLSELRKTFGKLLIVDKEALALAPEVEVDARLFEERLSPPSGDLEALAGALRYYRGDFLEGFTLPGCPQYCDWQVAERERYRRLAICGLATLAELYEKRGSLHEALEAVNRALELDPLQENLHRACMRLHYLAGDRPGAIRQYHRLRKLLDEEMGVPPMPQTQALYDAIVTDTYPHPGSTPVVGLGQPQPGRRSGRAPGTGSFVLPFVGRRSELQALCGLASDRRGGLVLIEGHPGVGKTRLVEEFLREEAALTIRGAGRELEQAIPYHPITEALRDLVSHPDWPALDAVVKSSLAPIWLAEIHRLVPEMTLSSNVSQHTDAAVGEYRLWEAVNQFLLALARRRPVIVFLDDLHWADASTLSLLGYLVRRAAGEPILFVAAARPVGSRSRLAALIRGLTRENLLVRLPLPPLQADDIALLAGCLSPSHSGMLAEWLTRGSEGNAYVLTELVRHLRERGILDENGSLDPGGLSATPLVPRTVEEFVKARLERLSETARRLLDVAAVVGRDFDVETVARVAPLSEEAVLDGLDELASVGLIRSLNGRRYSFDHSLTREVAYRELSETRRQWLHRRVAEALENTHRGCLEAVAAKIAWHFGQSNSPERAGVYALWAGNQASRLGAWTEAIAFYEQAVAVADDTVRMLALPSLGKVLVAAGHTGRAADVHRQAAALARSQGDHALSEFLLGAAAVSEAPHVVELVWGTSPMIVEPEVNAAASHFRTAEELYAKAQTVDPKILADIKIGLGLVCALQGDVGQAVACYQAALSVAEASREEDAVLDQILLSRLNLASYLHELGLPGALEHALTGLRLARDKGLLGFQPFLLSILGGIALRANDLDEAEKYLTEALALAERLAIPYAVAAITARFGRLAACRGQREEAFRQLSYGLSSADALGTPHLAIQIRLWLIALLGPGEAREHVAKVLAVAQSPICRSLFERIAPADGGN
jgi:DNA-binding SARP family transcriptional activator